MSDEVFELSEIIGDLTAARNLSNVRGAKFSLATIVQAQPLVVQMADGPTVGAALVYPPKALGQTCLVLETGGGARFVLGSVHGAGLSEDQ